MVKQMAEAGKLKEGRFIMIDDEPCHIIQFSVSSPKKNEHANATIKAIGLFDSQRHSVTHRANAKIEVPVIKRGSAEVLAIVANTAQLMDLTTYETFQLPISMGLRGDVREGCEIGYIQVLGRRKIELIKS